MQHSMTSLVPKTATIEDFDQVVRLGQEVTGATNQSSIKQAIVTHFIGLLVANLLLRSMGKLVTYSRFVNIPTFDLQDIAPDHKMWSDQTPTGAISRLTEMIKNDRKEADKEVVSNSAHEISFLIIKRNVQLLEIHQHLAHYCVHEGADAFYAVEPLQNEDPQKPAVFAEI